MLVSIARVHHRVQTNRGDNNMAPETAHVIAAVGPRVGAAVIEMGMGARGQIAHMCYLARPTVGVITNVARGHVRGCGGFLGVVKAKNEMVWGIRHGGTLIMNADDHGSKLLKTAGFRGRIVRFGTSPYAQYHLESIHYAKGGLAFMARAEGANRRFFLPTVGRHQVSNALAAMAAARSIGVSWDDIRRGLARYRPPYRRLTLKRGPKGSLLIDDTFNANPLSMTAALKTLKDVAGGRSSVAVLGDMADQGLDSAVQHIRLGRRVASVNPTRLVTVGPMARQIARGARAAGMSAGRVVSFASRAGAARYLRAATGPGSVILVKGSHATHLSALVTALTRRSA
jgi:UDP-N-acetylmuramoyl-tripeptide--D-alanyl-D-alanine ligase